LSKNKEKEPPGLERENIKQTQVYRLAGKTRLTDRNQYDGWAQYSMGKNKTPLKDNGV
jgi:hypothetical protein